MPLMRCVSNTAKTSVSSGVSWNSQSWALGPGGDQAVSSRPSDKRQRTPDSRTCCDGNVARRVDGGWQKCWVKCCAAIYICLTSMFMPTGFVLVGI